MPTTYTDQFFSIDPFSPPPAGTALNFVKYDLVDQNDDDDIDASDNDSVNGQDVTSSHLGDTVTINVPGVGNVTYTGITLYLADGTEVFTPTDGQVLQMGLWFPQHLWMHKTRWMWATSARPIFYPEL